MLAREELDEEQTRSLPMIVLASEALPLRAIRPPIRELERVRSGEGEAAAPNDEALELDEEPSRTISKP